MFCSLKIYYEVIRKREKMKEILKFNLYSVNKEKEEIKFSGSIKLNIEVDTHNYVVRVKGCEDSKIFVSDINIDDDSFDAACNAMDALKIEDNAILIFCKFMGESYLLSYIILGEGEEEFDSERFLNLLVDDFLKEIER